MRWQKSASAALAYWFKIIGVTLTLLMFMVWQHVEARLLERQLSGMRKEQDQLLYQNARMENQINQWIAPGHLETLARKELNMVPLDAQHRIGVQLP
jgi:cell division protein FtsL